MLVASKKKVQEIFFPTVDYYRKIKNERGEEEVSKVASKVGFYEIQKKKVLRHDKKNNLMIRGDVIKEEYVETEDEHGFKKVPYSGTTAIISIENSRFTRSTRPAEEQDKVVYKEAYAAHLAYKAEQEARDTELKEAKEKLAELEKKSEKEKAKKESKEAKE